MYYSIRSFRLKQHQYQITKLGQRVKTVLIIINNKKGVTSVWKLTNSIETSVDWIKMLVV